MRAVPLPVILSANEGPHEFKQRILNWISIEVRNREIPRSARDDRLFCREFKARAVSGLI
jgi:hypothetical protein